jgi:hypothetical protein
MKKRQIQRAVERDVAPRFPGFQPLGDLLVDRSGPILRGFALERSQMDKNTFRLRVFGQVLSVPSDAVMFDLSEELGDFHVDPDAEAAFEAAAEQAEARGREFLSCLDDCEVLLDSLDSLASETSDDRLIAEVRAQLLVYLGRDKDALHVLSEAAERATRGDRTLARRRGCPAGQVGAAERASPWRGGAQRVAAGPSTLH